MTQNYHQILVTIYHLIFEHIIDSIKLNIKQVINY